jgi:hypothetical protein
VEKVLADPQLQPAMLQGPPGPAGRDGRDGQDGQDGQSFDPSALQDQLATFREQILNEVQSLIESNPSQPIDTEALVNEVISKIPVCTCQEGEIAGKDPEIPNGPGVGKYLESQRVLYFTADSCTSCFEVTNLVNSLKRSGYPITVITLTTSMAEAHQVPQIFVPATGQRALGPSNVKEFLSQIQL